jgi:hypothetical protein
MRSVVYVAVGHRDEAGAYQARFPDLPAARAAGENPGSLLADARTALSAELQALADAGQDWPAATPIESLAAQPGEFLFLVDVEVDDTPVRVNISIGEQLLKRLDAAAAAAGATRSGFIAQAVRAKLGEKQGVAADFEGAARKLQDELAAIGRKLTDNLGPDSAFSRSMADLDDRVSATIQRAAESVSAAVARRREAERRATSKSEPVEPEI